jgi:predicted ATPase/class 3 adenylate cyclase
VSTLPGGAVTLLFTDVEGSTRLAHELGERWAAVLSDHRRLLREAFAAHDGHEVDTQGDAFFVAFARAADAAGAAAAAQRLLAAHPWPQGAELRVRIGVHSGEPLLTEEGYVGVDVHRAARVCAAAHGGQVLLSAAAREGLDGFTVSGLGEFRLKDMTAAEPLFQLEVEGVPASFPPPRSLNATNLPTQPSPLIGRRDDVAAALGLLRTEARLVTLTGPGGTGKTRLALQLAAELVHEFADGIYWVPLAPVSDPGVVGNVIAATIGAPVESDGLLRFLRERELLLLIDNFEHLLPAAPLVSEILVAAARVKVLATSRAPLHVSGEQEFHVSPLAETDAVELFTARAKAVRPSFDDGEASAEICRRVDCIPLAIELAASRLRHLTASALLARLDRSLAVLTGGARDLPERQQTLRATIDWSYRLLEPGEQRLLDRLAVFAGSTTLEQVERVCVVDGDSELDVLDGVASLVDKSLLRWFEPPEGPARYFLLETVHEFALERLVDRGEEPTLRRRHRDCFLELAERLEPIDRVAGIHELVPDRNNLRAALRWSLDEDAAAAETLRLAFVLWRYWVETGSITEGRQWLDLALARTRPSDRVLEAQALDAAAFLAAQQGDFDGALALNDRSVALARALPDAPRVLGWCLFRRGQIELDRGRLDAAVPPLREAAEIFHGERWPIAEAWALIELSRGELLSGRFRAARSGFANVVELERGDEETIAFAYGEVLLGSVLALEGEVEAGLAYVEAGLEALGGLDARFTQAVALLHAAPAYHVAGDLARERGVLAQALRLALDGGIVPRASACLEGAARIAADAHDHATAARLWGAADQSCRELGIVPNPLRLRLREEFERPARSALGSDRFTREFERGRSLSLPAALELGLRTIESAEDARVGACGTTLRRTA